MDWIIPELKKVTLEALLKILTINRIELMGKIAEEWEPFEIQVTIEGETKSLLVVPDREESKYQIFDQHTSLGLIWQENGKTGKVWCGEGMVVRALVTELGEQVENYLNNKPV